MSEKLHEDPLNFIRRCCRGYLHGLIRDRWGGYGKGLRFVPGGEVRLGQILGWLDGLASMTSEEQRKFAADAAGQILENLDYLSTYGGTVDTGLSVGQIPQYLVELGDDGTFNGFTVLWRPAASPQAQADYGDEAKAHYGDDPEQRYLAGWAYGKTRTAGCWNGGLLYHGPGQGEIYSVSLSSRLWSIHT